MSHPALKKLLLLLCSTLTILAGTIISPALPKIEEVFTAHNDISLLVGLVLTITSLFIALSAPFAGVLADKFGRKPLLLFSLFLYGLAGSAGVFLQSVPQILISRIFLGFSVAGIMTSATTLIGDYFEGDERERFLGFQASFIALGGVVFLISGGLLASLWWRAPFLIYALSWLLILPAFYVLTEPPHIVREFSIEDKEVSYSRFFMIIGTALLGMMIYFLIPTQLPFYLHDDLNFTPRMTGFYMAAGIFFSALISSRYQVIHKYLSKPAIYALSFCLMGTGLTLISELAGSSLLLMSIALTGLGFGLIIPNSTVWTTEIAPESLRGRMLGGLTASLFFGQFLSTLFGETVHQTFGTLGPTGVFGFGSLLSLAAGFAFVTVIIGNKILQNFKQQ